MRQQNHKKMDCTKIKHTHTHKQLFQKSQKILLQIRNSLINKTPKPQNKMDYTKITQTHTHTHTHTQTNHTFLCSWRANAQMTHIHVQNWRKCVMSFKDMPVTQSVLCLIFLKCVATMHCLNYGGQKNL